MHVEKTETWFENNKTLTSCLASAEILRLIQAEQKKKPGEVSREIANAGQLNSCRTSKNTGENGVDGPSRLLGLATADLVS